MSDSAPNLLDVNYLVALAWPNHIAHARAVSWFLENRTSPFATCPMTEAGFVRVSMNPLIVSDQTTVKAALDMLKKYRTTYRHIFWPDDLEIADALSSFKQLSGHRQITDAYLLALAKSHNGKLVTFDGGIAAIASPNFQDSLILVEY
jgi:hypothetical protein